MVEIRIDTYPIMERCTDCDSGYTTIFGNEVLCECCGGNGWFEIDVHVNEPIYRVNTNPPW
jgi:rRNA maturation endonuclease Nob1